MYGLATLDFLIAVLPWITVLAGNFLKIDKRPAPNKELPGREKVVQDVFLLSAYEVPNKRPARNFLQN